MNKKILFVDDDANLLSAIKRTLHKQFSIETMTQGAAALRQLHDCGPYAVLVADMQMPGMDGLQLLKKAQRAVPDTVRVMLTGNTDQKTAMDAVNDGSVFRFLTKPCPPLDLIPALEAALDQYRLINAERELLENTLGGAVKVLTEILCTTDPFVFEQSQQLKDYVERFARSSGVTASWELELSAMLCRIGRITIPATVLAKHRAGLSLTDAEKDVLNRIPEVSAQLLEKIPRLENVATIVRYQQKHFDGTGFPSDSVAGEFIPIGARILKVLMDLVEIEARSISRVVALQQMTQRTGWYDTTVLLAASRCFDIALEQPAGKVSPPQWLRIQDLRPGHVLAQDLRTGEGTLILVSDAQLSPTLIEKIRNFRLLKAISDTILVYVE